MANHGPSNLDVWRSLGAPNDKIKIYNVMHVYKNSSTPITTCKHLPDGFISSKGWTTLSCFQRAKTKCVLFLLVLYWYYYSNSTCKKKNKKTGSKQCILMNHVWQPFFLNSRTSTPTKKSNHHLTIHHHLQQLHTFPANFLPFNLFFCFP